MCVCLHRTVHSAKKDHCGESVWGLSSYLQHALNVASCSAAVSPTDFPSLEHIKDLLCLSKQKCNLVFDTVRFIGITVSCHRYEITIFRFYMLPSGESKRFWAALEITVSIKIA